MKRLFGLLALLGVSFFPASAVTVTLCGTPADPGGSSVSTLSVTCTPGTGDTLVFIAVTQQTITQTIAGGGNTFVVPSVTNLNGFPNWQGAGAAYNLWVVFSANAGSTTFTVTNSAGSSFNSLVVVDIAGASSPAVDCGNHNLAGAGGSYSAVGTGPCTTTVTGDVIIGFSNRYAVPGCSTPVSPALSLFHSTGSGAATIYAIEGAPGSYALSCTISGTNYDAFQVALSVVAASGSNTQVGGFLVGP